MRWLLNWVKNLLSPHREQAARRKLMSMYLKESNAGGMRKSNRERN